MKTHSSKFRSLQSVARVSDPHASYFTKLAAVRRTAPRTADTLSMVGLAFRMAALVVFSAAMIPAASAQSGPPKVGFIRVVNAIGPGSGNMQLLIDGENMFPKGYKLGQRTGGIGLKAGSRRIEVRKEGIEPGTTKMKLATGETVTMIAFAEPVPVEKQTKKDAPKWSAKILRLRQRDVERGFRMTVVSVSKRPSVSVQVAAEARGKVQNGTVKRMGVTSFDLGGGRGDVMLKIDGETLAQVSLDDPGNYVVVIYDDDDGKIHGLSFYDPKFVIAG